MCQLMKPSHHLPVYGVSAYDLFRFSSDINE